jgi:hypothetical protein
MCNGDAERKLAEGRIPGKARCTALVSAAKESSVAAPGSDTGTPSGQAVLKQRTAFMMAASSASTGIDPGGMNG